ncbi:MAG TPA: RNA polymerase sigma factor [Candidatus Paceibacterota bacterium]|nr:RNA polymerase sigma factor [Candidatus Paceibacterota bacterium]
MIGNEQEKEFLKLYDDLADPIFRHCFFRVSDREKAKDIMQETFTRTWEYLAKGETVKNLKAFVYRVANNLIIDSYRKKKEDSLDRMQEDGFDIGVDEREKIMDMLSGREVIALMADLGDKYREVIVMRYIDDLMPREIAEIIGESENVISVRLHRGLRQLRDLIKKSEELS